MSPSKIFLYLCFSFIAGIFIGSFTILSLPILMGFLIIGILLISVFWPENRFNTNRKIIVVIGFCILCLILGIWKSQLAIKDNSNSQIKSFNDAGEKIKIIATIINQPERGEKIQRFIIKTENVAEQSISGKVLVTANLYPEYKYGDKLNVFGKLETPSFSDDYREYLEKDGIFSILSWPKIEKIGSGFGSPIMKFLFAFKDKFKEITRKFISPPQQGLLEALFFGDEENISKEWKDKINIIGIRHIAAVSGMNITIISSLILSFALGIGMWRKQAFYFSIILIILYILMIGAPSSAVRAGILGGLFMLGQHLGRFSAASRAIVFAAAFMLLLNPLLLKIDIGFQLSFLAMLGIIYLQPIFSNIFKKIPNPKIFPLSSTLSTTLAAQVFTLPILIYNFGYISSVSPITNILIVPIISPLTIIIFIFGACSMIFYPLGYLFSWLAWIGLTYIIFIVDFFSKVPFATINIQNLSLLLGLVYYFFVIVLIFWWKKREQNKLLNY